MPVRYTIKDMQAIAREQKGKCLGREYVNDGTLLTWMCEKGHTWDASYALIRQGYWCPQCARHKKEKERLEELQEIAKGRSGKLLSTSYINQQTKLKWQCNKGHVWMTTPDSINQGSWCPVCGYVKASETRRRTLQLKTG